MDKEPVEELQQLFKVVKVDHVVLMVALVDWVLILVALQVELEDLMEEEEADLHITPLGMVMEDLEEFDLFGQEQLDNSHQRM
jgi:hypothetical protein